MRREPDGRVEQHEPLDAFRRARGDLVRDPSAERVAETAAALRRATSRSAARWLSRSQGGSQGESPWPSRSGAGTWKRPARRSARPAKCRPCDVTPCRQRTRRPAVVPHSYQARSHSPIAASGPETSSVTPLALVLDERPDDGSLLVDEERAAQRRAALLVEDAVRLGGPSVRPEVGREGVLDAELLAPRLTRRRGVAGYKHDLRLGIPEGLEVLLQVAGLLLAERRERERVEHQQDVVAAGEARQPHALPGSHLQVELRRLPPVSITLVLLAVAGRTIVPPSPQLAREVVELEAARVVMRVDVALAVAELLGAA